jgi:predicted GNAT family N-acyltransferase
VLPEFQGREIGRRLFDRAVEQARRNLPGITKLEVHSSPVALSVYQELGFSVTGPEKVDDGIRYIPMEHLLSPDSNTSMGYP